MRKKLFTNLFARVSAVMVFTTFGGVSSVSLHQSRISQYIRTSMTSWNLCFNQWECMFWLECRVSQQTKKFKMVDKERVVNAFQCHEYGSSGGIYLSWIELNTVEVTKRRKVCICGPCQRQISPGNDYPRTEESTKNAILIENCGPSLTSCFYHFLERDHRIGKQLYSVFFKCRNDWYVNWDFSPI